MFSLGSRYRKLPESSPVVASGERLRGKDLRLIPATPGEFLHTVSESERLDLLAYNYYEDGTKWWQIGDANPEFPFPTDLLDQRPIVAERLALTPFEFNARFASLLAALDELGTVQHVAQNFLASTVVMVYDPLTTARQQILDKIKETFHFLRAFAWPVGAQIAEAFTFDDLGVEQPGAKMNWPLLLDDLLGLSGILAVQSIAAEATLLVVYNNAMVARETILAQVQRREFAVLPEASATLSRPGSKIIIPPQQIV